MNPSAPAQPIIVIQGAKGPADIPNIDTLPDDVEIRFAAGGDAFADALHGADVLFGWDFRGDLLQSNWQHADSLRWIQWSGAGVDTVIFDDLVQSDVILTNARGVFDRAMAEYAVGLMLAHFKKFPKVFADQRSRHWEHGFTNRLTGRRALIVGVGSIGREMARLFRAVGLEVAGVGRRARSGDPDFGTIHAVADLDSVLGTADIVMLIVPYTPETENMFGAEQFAAMQETALFMNFGRGALVDEDALIAALATETIAGAAIDVARQEPLPADHPLWRARNIIITPHVSGDYIESLEDIAALFYDNLGRYMRGEPLRNLVDKHTGFAAPDPG